MNKISFDEYQQGRPPFSLTQENPSVFTKLSCYLPWIAGQYQLSYEHEKEVLNDKSCMLGTGDPEDSQTCRESIGYFNAQERPCIFPFYYDGALQDKCFQYTTNAGFFFPLFVCPTWNVTNKMNGINSYGFRDLALAEYCPNADGELDSSDKSCPISERIPPLVSCKNDCPGGELNYILYLLIMNCLQFVVLASLQAAP